MWAAAQAAREADKGGSEADRLLLETPDGRSGIDRLDSTSRAELMSLLAAAMAISRLDGAAGY